MEISIAQACLIDFILVDSLGAVVTGKGSSFTIEISKNGGAFSAGLGVKAEIGSGWYSYTLTVAETDTAGPLAIKATGSGVVQQNLLYHVTGSIWTAPAGPNILTATEAANVLRCADDDANMLMLLTQVDTYVYYATGRNWAVDTTIHPIAKAAARMLLVMWHENPGMMANGQATLGWGLTACLVQLETLALQYKHFQGINGAGECDLTGARIGDTVETLVGLIGATGDQSSAFEAVITVDNHIQQVSTGDLSGNWYRVYLVPVESLP